MLKTLLVFCMMALCAPAAFASDACIAAHIPRAAIIGRGTETRFSFRVYDATLYAAKGIYSSQKAFALTLTYHMNFNGTDIAGETVKQMRHLGMSDAETLDAWQKKMNDIFPDVKPGDAITGLHLANGQTVFCQSGDEIGRIRDKDFGNYFFGIWLDNNTENKELRRKLLGQS